MEEFKNSDIVSIVKQIKTLFPEFGNDEKKCHHPKLPFSLGSADGHLGTAIFVDCNDIITKLIMSLKLSKEVVKTFKEAFGKNPSLILLKIYAILVLNIKVDAKELITPLIYPTYVDGVKKMVETDSVLGLVTADLLLSLLHKEHTSYSNLVRDFFNLKSLRKKKSLEKKGDNEKEILTILSKNITLPFGLIWITSLLIKGKLPSGVTGEFDICLVGPTNIVYLIIECKRTMVPSHPEKHKNGHEIAKTNGLISSDKKEEYTVSSDVISIFITEVLASDTSTYQKKWGTLFKISTSIDLFSISKYGSLVLTKNPEELDENNVDDNKVGNTIPEYSNITILRYKPPSNV